MDSTTHTSWPLKVVKERAYLGREYRRGRIIRVTAGLVHLQGNDRPYFSITADIKHPRAADIDAGGQMHDAIRRYFPKVAPLLPLHMADDLGTPHQCEANGWYWLAGALGGFTEKYHGGNGNPPRSPEQCLKILAGLCRMDLDEAVALTQHIKRNSHPRAAWAAALDLMRPRWKHEANAGKELLLALGAKELPNA